MPFPVTESTLSATSLAEKLRVAYSLGAATTCHLFRTGINHSYLLHDESNKYFFRVYTFQWRTKTEISEEVRLLSHLAQQGVPVSYPIAATGGEYLLEFQAPEGLRYGVLFSFAEGAKSSDLSNHICHETGVVMARMHIACNNMQLQRVNYNVTTMLENSYQSTRAFFGDYSEDMRFIRQLTNYLIEQYDQVDLSNIRHGVIHVDIWFDNMHINEAGVPVIFDFDFCGNGRLFNDPAYFLFQLHSTNPDEQVYYDKEAAFLNGYRSVTIITEEEMRILPQTALNVILFYLGVQCEKYDTWSNIFLNEDHLTRFAGRIKKWMAFHKIFI